jgi:hypothetical protein
MPIQKQFSLHIFEKFSDVKFNENPSSGSRVVPCRYRNKHDEANGPFHSSASAPQNGRMKKFHDTDVYSFVECSTV